MLSSSSKKEKYFLAAIFLKKLYNHAGVTYRIICLSRDKVVVEYLKRLHRL